MKRAVTMACSWARLAMSARRASRRARARRRISACRTACSRLASRGRRRRARPARVASVSAPRASWRSVSSPRQQQRAQPVGLRGGGGGQLLARAEQDAQRFAVAVGARGGQPVGVQAQRGQHGQVRVDRVGLALAAAGLAVGLLALDDEQAGRGGGAGQADAVAAGALDGHHQPRSGGVVDDPGQQLGVAGAVVADLAGRDRASPVGSAISTSWVSRWVSTPTTASTSSASMGTGLVSFRGSGSNGRHRPGWESPSGTSVTGHAHGRTDIARAVAVKPRSWLRSGRPWPRRR